MTCEIINLAERRNKRIVRVVRRDSFNPYGVVFPVASLVCLAMWTTIIVNTVALFEHAKPPS